ncbi:MAG: hypothetical protein ACI8XM_002322 [Haloarculaceae archaeon]|jgi:hypothetical protein
MRGQGMELNVDGPSGWLQIAVVLLLGLGTTGHGTITNGI